MSVNQLGRGMLVTNDETVTSMRQAGAMSHYMIFFTLYSRSSLAKYSER